MSTSPTPTLDRGTPDPVVLAVWPWRQRIGKPAAAPAPRISAKMVVIQTLVAAAIAFLFYWKHHFWMATLVASIAGVLALCSLVWPAGYRGVEHAFKVLGVYIGRVLTHVLLVPCFILIFGTAHFFIFLFRRDPLGRHYLPGQPSYWEDRAPVTNAAQHLEVPY